VDQSNVTGESDLVKKHNAIHGTSETVDCFLISGSKLEMGFGKMVVLAVGRHSFCGKQLVHI
jgi:Ca2+-transporting ATPase